MNYIKKRMKAFAHAFSGVISAFREEQPFKVHLLATITVTGLGFYFNVTRTEWCILILCCATVIAFELLNTSIERLSDVVKPENDPRIKFIKDAGAGAVLIAAVGAAIIGVIIFYPYFKTLLDI